MNEVFSEAQPGAILGASWGQISTQPSSSKQPPVHPTHRRSSITHGPSSPKSSYCNHSNNDHHNNNNNSGDDDDDDDYTTLSITSWDQCSAKPKSTTAARGWGDLVDPNFQIKANGLGSGNLHRKGVNYVPVDESYILQQRSKQPNSKAVKKSLKAKESPAVAQAQASANGIQPSPPKAKKKAKAAKKVKPVIPSASYQSNTTTTTTTTTTTKLTNDFANRVDVPADSRWNADQLASVPFWQQSYAPTTSSSVSSSLPSPHGSSYAYDSTVSTTAQTSPQVTASLLHSPPIEPVLVIKIPIATGIKIDLPIGKEDPKTTVKRFVEKHSFDVDDTVLHKLHHTVSLLQDAAVRRMASSGT